MGEMASVWGCAEGNQHHDMEQLGQKLLCTTLELQKLKAEVTEEMRKNKEYVKELIHLLKVAIQERDEARDQLLKLLSNTTADAFLTVPHFLTDDGTLVKPAKETSNITESNSLSEAHNYRSHGSSPPVESLLDAVTSPDFSNINLVISQPRIDRASLILDSLAKGRALPQRGKFLLSVLEAGPLLQTLVLAGPLPRWRNPPQLQPLQIPPVSIKGCATQVFAQKPAANVANPPNRQSLNSEPYYARLSGGAMSNSGNAPSGTVLDNGTSLLSSGVGEPLAKRLRFC